MTSLTHTSLPSKALSVLSLWFASAAGFSSLSIPGPSYPSVDRTVTATSSAPWRIVLDIGREPLANNGMPFEWARSGCRMPLVIPCRLLNDKSVEPVSEMVRFTGPDGEVARPVDGGVWTMDGKESWKLSLKFPETLERRDVSIPAGTTLECNGALYTKKRLDELNGAFYQAREETWKLGRSLNEMVARQEAPKKWNEDTKQWGKRYKTESPLVWAGKKLQYARAKAKQADANQKRPDPNSLSAAGSLPGIEGEVFVARGGVVRATNGGVMGTWFAEPITNEPVSYMR